MANRLKTKNGKIKSEEMGSSILMPPLSSKMNLAKKRRKKAVRPRSKREQRLEYVIDLLAKVTPPAQNIRAKKRTRISVSHYRGFLGVLKNSMNQA
jgi:hypothetical protein